MKKLIATTSLFALIAAAPAFAQDQQAPANEPLPPANEQSQPQALPSDSQPANEGMATDSADNPKPAGETAETAPMQEPSTDMAKSDTESTTAMGQGWRASNLIGRQVLNTENEAIGDINDFILDDQGKVVHVLVGVGGFLGLGEKVVAIQIDKLNLQRGENDDIKVTTDATKASLEAASPWLDSKN